MRTYLLFAVLVLFGSVAAAAPESGLSIWQIESNCAAWHPVAKIESCTRNGLNMEYGNAWKATPAANQFLAFIGATAERVKTGQMNEADGRLAISTYAKGDNSQIQAERAAHQQERQAAQQQERQFDLQRELAAMAQDYPGSQGAAAMGRALSGESSQGDTSLFDGNGKPVAYIDAGDDMTIYLWAGEPAAYLDGNGSGQDNVYGFNGRHLGWFSHGVIWDHSGYAACAVRQRLMAAPQIEPIKGVQQVMPVKAVEQIAPVEPVLVNSFGNDPCESLLASGADSPY